MEQAKLSKRDSVICGRVVFRLQCCLLKMVPMVSTCWELMLVAGQNVFVWHFFEYFYKRIRLVWFSAKCYWSLILKSSFLAVFGYRIPESQSDVVSLIITDKSSIYRLKVPKIRLLVMVKTSVLRVCYCKTLQYSAVLCSCNSEHCFC